jgi:hypothetical protein
MGTSIAIALTNNAAGLAIWAALGAALVLAGLYPYKPKHAPKIAGSVS